MSRNSANDETRKTRLRRTLCRIYKKIFRLPLVIDDISLIRCPPDHGVTFEACRDSGSTWNVYRVYKVAYGRRNRLVYETLYVSLPLPEALDTLYHLSPGILKGQPRASSHPAVVARIIGHRFGSTD